MNILLISIKKGTLRCLFYNLYHQLLHFIGFLYQALLMYLHFAGVEVLGVSSGVVILLEHPAIYRQNVVNKKHSINFFK
ncbi:hypothetical protein COI65_10350 [Bacillus wiedmannii]|jgi:hypothetical protein|uniref:Uncharacterized protein n=2 Tax=Bacillus wiedmannii TaxID=1890302 RepID=A0A2C5PX14_9BACI|nr:hypothetical protein COI65_10350 [Bacillus wiedmannii]